MWLINERSQLRTEIGEFKSKFDQHDANFVGIKAYFNVTEAHITDLKDSIDNAESDFEMDFHDLTKNITSLRTDIDEFKMENDEF